MEEDLYIKFNLGQSPYISDINLNQMQKMIKADIKQQIADAKNNVEEAINGEIIFENEAGLNDNITTNKNITSFKNIKIDYFMTLGDYTLKDSKIIQINTGESFQLSFVITHSTQLIIFDSARYLVNNATTIKKQVELDTRIGSANDVTFNGEVSRIKITKITGYLD